MINIDFSDEISKLPPSVHSGSRLRQLLSSGKATVYEISNVLSQDPILVARVLKLANSPFFSVGRSIKSVKQAVIMLGQRVIGHLVLTASFGILNESGILIPPLSPASFGTHSLVTAYLCKLIASATNNANSDEAFTLGLLHDVGIFLMLLKFKKIYASIIGKVGDNNKGEEREIKLFKTSHSLAAKTLFEEWKIPDDLILAVSNHHHQNIAGHTNFDFLTEVEKWSNLMGYGLINTKHSARCPSYFFYEDVKFKTADLIEQLNEFLDQNQSFT